MTAGLGLELDDANDAPLVATESSLVTRGQLRSKADALLGALQACAARRALVCSDDPVHILRAVDACNRAGVDLWIAHTNLPKEYVEEVITQFGIQYTIGEEDVPRDTSAEGAPPGSRIHMMTSGTTGRPKVAVHSLESLLSRVRAAANFPANREGKWLLTYQPTGFAGVQVILTAVLSRGLVVVPEQRTPAGFYRAAKAHEVTQISATPTFWRSLLMVVEPNALKLRQITLGGEAADQATMDRLRAAFPEARVTHIYASTEAGVVFAVHDGREGFPSAWLSQPTQGVELRIVDGFLQIKTANAMRGYATESAQPLLDDGWLGTADRCETRGDRVYVLGRQDSTINVGGSKVYPLAVETFLLGLPGVAEARVFGVKNPVSGSLVAAEVVLRQGEDRDEARTRILAACRDKLAGYQVPRIFKIVDSIAIGASGKKVDVTARKHVIVTGGSRGLGAAMIAGLLADGYRVSTCSRSKSDNITALLANPEFEGRFFWGECRVGEADQVDRFVRDAITWAGDDGIYGLVNNAGIAQAGILASFPNVESEKILRINLLGAIQVARAVSQYLLLRKEGGRIINISSIIGSRGYNGLAAYSASKAGMDGLTRALARELGRRQITVNSVCPGYVKTEMSATLNPAQIMQIVGRTPLGRLATEEDVLALVRFLLSEAAGMITGQIILVDGGVSC